MMRARIRRRGRLSRGLDGHHCLRNSARLSCVFLRPAGVNARNQQASFSKSRGRGSAGLRPRAWSTRAQFEEYRSRHSPRCPGGVYRRVRLGQIVAGVRHALRGGAAAVSESCRPMRGVCFIRWRFPRLTKSMACPRPWPCSSSAGRPLRALPSAAYDAVQPASNAVLARRRLFAAPGASRCRGFFAQYAGGSLSPMPWARSGLRGDRTLDGAG